VTNEQNQFGQVTQTSFSWLLVLKSSAMISFYKQSQDNTYMDYLFSPQHLAE